MEDREEALRQILQDFLRDIKALLQAHGLEVPVELEDTPTPTASETGMTEEQMSVFFSYVRTHLFRDTKGKPRLTQSQVDGMKSILKGLHRFNIPRSWAAYVLATAFHETAQRMQPVREGLNASDAWRRRNLRYYPWYGRGHVQLTWEDNYRKADRELGLGGTLLANADRALEPDISVEIMIRGMIEGWFSGDNRGRHTLERHLTNRDTATRAQFQQARRIVNLMDRNDLIAGQALHFQTALTNAGY
jgi:hypothetical protein